MRVEKGGASVEVKDHGEIYEVSNLEVPEGSNPLKLLGKVSQMTKDKDVWITVDAVNEGAAKLFIQKGFEIAFVVMRRRKET